MPALVCDPQVAPFTANGLMVTNHFLICKCCTRCVLRLAADWFSARANRACCGLPLDGFDPSAPLDNFGQPVFFDSLWRYAAGNALYRSWRRLSRARSAALLLISRARWPHSRALGQSLVEAYSWTNQSIGTAEVVRLRAARSLLCPSVLAVPHAVLVDSPRLARCASVRCGCCRPWRTAPPSTR